MSLFADLLTQSDLINLPSLQPEGWPDIRQAFGAYIVNDFCYPFTYSFNDKLAGVACLISFGTTGWLAHIIVDKHLRKQGLGCQIVQHLLEMSDQKGINTLSLIATELGEPVYRKYGFRVESEYLHFDHGLGRDKVFSNANICLYKSSYLHKVLQLDKFVTGETRSALLFKHIHGAMLYLEDDSLEGIYLPTLGEGPVYARSEKAGLALLELKAGSASGIVIPSENQIAIGFLQQQNYTFKGVKGNRMVLGSDLTWQPQCFYNRLGGNYG